MLFGRFLCQTKNLRLLYVSRSKVHSYSSKNIRETFIQFYQDRNHEFIPSSKVYSPQDKSLLFVNAGMNQFKPILLGQGNDELPFVNVKRAVNSQKCIRAGGKHNDLDDVGHDLTHHTFFEMLGSWSFADYFKDEACKMAWSFLTEVLKLPPERLYVTYFAGCVKNNLEPDYDTKEIWKSIGVHESRILPFGSSDNFWEMGETGPCGPCTEIHYDRIGNRHAPEQVNQVLSDIVEIWNIVFMQYNRVNSKVLEPLSNRHVDSGMGLERITAVMQGKTSNYDTDLFISILSALEELSQIGPYEGRVGVEDIGGKDAAYRIISDHIRMLTVAISDGIYPGPNGRELILRKVLRRAVLAGMDVLGTPRPFLSTLVPIVVESLSPAFPEIKEKKNEVIEIINDSEIAFYSTLERGDTIVRKSLKNLPGNVFPSKLAFQLKQQLGYPTERLLKILKQENKTIFSTLSDTQSEGTVSAFKPLKKEMFFLQNEEDKSSLIHNLSKEKFPKTVISQSSYDECAKVLAVVINDGTIMKKYSYSGLREDIYILLDSTTLYHPSHVGSDDMGSFNINGVDFNVTSVINLNGWVLHQILPSSANPEHLLLGNGNMAQVKKNKDHFLPLTRAYSACHVMKQTCIRLLPQHSILKFKSEFDSFKIELAGDISSNDISKLENNVRSTVQESKPFTAHADSSVGHVYRTDEIGNVIITKCRRQGKAKTILTFAVGNRANAAIKTCTDMKSNVKELVSKFEKSEFFDAVSVEQFIKEIGDSTFALNKCEMSYQDKMNLRGVLRTMSGRMNSLQKRLKNKTIKVPAEK